MELFLHRANNYTILQPLFLLAIYPAIHTCCHIFGTVWEASQLFDEVAGSACKKQVGLEKNITDSVQIIREIKVRQA